MASSSSIPTPAPAGAAPASAAYPAAYPGTTYAEPAPSSASTSTDTKSKLKKYFDIGNPFPKSIEKDCQRSIKVLDSYLQIAQEKALIPDSVLQTCKGLVFVTAVKAGYVWSVRFASGIVVARLEDGSWSAPSSLVAFGVGYGAQVGLEFADFVIVLRDDNALNAFCSMGNVTIGGNLSVALGPWGRSVEVDIPATCALLYSLNHTRGLFAGLSIEGTMFLENRKANEKCYGKGAAAKSILTGQVRPSEAVLPFINVLTQRFSSAAASALPTYASLDKAPLLQGQPRSDAGPSSLYPSIEHQYQYQGNPGDYQKFVDAPLEPVDLKVQPEGDRS